MGFRDTLRDLVGVAAEAAGSGLLDWAGRPVDLSKSDRSEQANATTDPNSDSGGAVQDAQDKDVADPSSMFNDPFAIIEQLGYKERPTSITYGTLRAMVYKLPILNSIIQTRINQASAFAKPQRDRYDLGFQINLRDKDAKPTAADKKWIAQTQELILHTGVTDDPRHRDNFEQLIRKLVWDSLVYDQLALEIVPDRRGIPAQWYAVDASSIRLADVASAYYKKKIEQDTKYVQIYDGMIVTEYTNKELCFGIRNPKTDMRLYGYGTSELEMMMIAVTSLLWGWEHNQRAFSQGTSAKGILNFKGSVNEKQLKGFRRHWYTMLSGVSNCVSGNTHIWTDDGGMSIKSFLGHKTERETNIWTGTGWAPGLVYATGEPKTLCHTKLGNGLKISTSPDHRFRVMSELGELVWKPQNELVEGDYVALNKKEVTATQVPRFRDQAVTPEMLEVLGWYCGDGYMEMAGKRKIFQLYYHPEKEEWLWKRHAAILKELGVDNVHTKEVIRTPEEKSDLIERYGFKSVQDRVLFTQVISAEFVEWLVDDLGFRPSRQGKVIPPWVHTLPPDHKHAFLRGWFSADGSLEGKRSPVLCISSNKLRDQMRNLLMSAGIRCNRGEGKHRVTTFGPQRAGYLLWVRDKDRFLENVGFLQPHKQPTGLVKKNQAGKNHTIDGRAAIHYCRAVREAKNKQPGLFTTRETNDLNSIICGIDRCSLSRLLRFMDKVGVTPPDHLIDYHYEPVVELEDTGEEVQMYDVEVRDDLHQFIGNGIAIHNSHRTPITNADEIQWVDLDKTNRDQEYGQWMDFLIKVLCSSYNMDPVEVNFSYGNVGQKSSLMESNNSEKVTQSKERGLRPLLRFLAMILNEHVIWPMNDNFELTFVGLDADTHDDIAKRNQMRVKTTSTVDELRMEDGRDPLNDGLGEVILDPTWVQWALAKQTAEQGGDPAQQPPGADAFGQDADDQDDDPDETQDLDFQRMLAAEMDEDDDEDDEEDNQKSSSGKPDDRLQKGGNYSIDIEL